MRTLQGKVVCFGLLTNSVMSNPRRVDDFVASGPSLAAALSSATISIILVDALQAAQPIIAVNQAFTDLTGYAWQEAVGRNCRFLQGPLTDPGTAHTIRRALTAGVSVTCELQNYRKDGTTFWNGLTIDPIRNSEGLISHFIGFQRDVSRMYEAADELASAEEKLANLVQNIPGYIFRRAMRADLSFRYTFLSRSIFRILGMPEDTDWSKNELVDHVHADDRPDFLKAVVQSGLDLTPLRSEFRLVSPSGRQHWFRSNSLPRAATNGEIVWEGIALDVTAEKTSDLKLTYLAHHDSLTGLSNRLLFRVSVVEAITQSASKSGSVGLCYVDIDDFQTLNEELGQAAGDLVLQHVGEHLLVFAHSCGGTVARLGGDEFALLIPTVENSVDLLTLAESVRLDLLRPAQIAGRSIVTDVCVGAVMYQGIDDTISCNADERAAELMRRADLALRRSKHQGPGSCAVYSAVIDDRVQNRMALRRSLQGGLSNEQFELHYQPLVHLATGDIVGAEALVRWNHPDLGMQRPDLFIPYAEASGLIVPLGAWIMKKAMQQAQAWRAAGLVPPRIAINLSGVQLRRPDFMATVERTLHETGAKAADFEFELTEGTLIGAALETHRDLQRLRALGFGLAIDDFGTGHSTLKYLRDFPVHKIKIDQAFIRQLVIDSNDAAIIRAIVALSRSMKLNVVAEGIETIMQRDFLRDEGCPVGQGYLLSMPLAAEDFAWLLASGRKLLPMKPVVV